MIMNRIFRYVVLGLTLLAVACEQHDALMYDNDAQVCFARGEDGFGQQDSVLHSFFLVPSNQDRDTVWVELALMGFPMNEDRPVKLIQTNTGAANAAVAGVHYVAFDDPVDVNQIMIGAGQVSTKIPVIFLRDVSLKTDKVRLELTIGENGYFKPGIDSDRNFMLQTTELAEQPVNWEETWEKYFGTWSSQKMWFIVNYLGLTEFEEEYEQAYMVNLKLKAHTKLNEYNELQFQQGKEPLCDDPYKHHENGEKCESCVVFP